MSQCLSNKLDKHLAQLVREYIYAELVKGANRDDLFIDVMLLYPVLRFYQLNYMLTTIENSINNLRRR